MRYIIFLQHPLLAFNLIYMCISTVRFSCGDIIMKKVNIITSSKDETKKSNDKNLS